MLEVINTLTIHGEDRLVGPLKEKLKTSNPFQTIVPYPEGLPVDYPETESEFRRRADTYGHVCGLEWMSNNWGTTEAPNDWRITEDKTTSLTLVFTTKVNPARTFVKRLIHMHPEVGYKLHFSCQQQGYEGAYYWREGRTRRDRTWRFGGDPDRDRF